MSEPGTLSVAEVAAATGFSRVALYRAVKDGRLSRWLVRDDKGHARLMAECVGPIRSGVLRVRAETRRAAPAPEPEPAPELPQPSWLDVAAWANELLDCSAWSAPPWPADRWATLNVVLDQASDLAAEHGPFNVAVLEQLDKEADALAP